MRKLFIPLLAFAIVIPSGKALCTFGFGLYGLKDNFSISSYEESFSFLGQDLVSMSRTAMSPPIGLGAFVYIDAIPFFDVEANIEIAGQKYDFSWEVAGTAAKSYELGWLRSASYVTIRKELVDLTLPILGGVNLHGGGGVNFQTSLPLVDKEFMEGFLESAGSEINVDKIKDEVSKNTGAHIQAGAQLKVLAFNAYLNGRYTIVKGVIPDKTGYLSVWLGLALSF
jgi:hypothetical protein|tara:strand:+ start:149 stop:826 length:678 start_codon:yes stop_codon:yes gene_type:complete